MLQRIVAVVLVCVAAVAQTAAPERKVEGSVLVSERDPSVRIELPTSVQYAGADRWVLYDLADCELHAFVDADAQKNVRRLYWVQFEAYVPSRPELRHTYDSPRHASIGGMDFYVDTWVRTKDAPMRPGSDVEHIMGLIRAKGYQMPAGIMSVRLVHLLDEQKRQELMIIYSEDVSQSGSTAVELSPEGKAYSQWPAVEKGLIERAEKSIRIEQTKP